MKYLRLKSVLHVGGTLILLINMNLLYLIGICISEILKANIYLFFLYWRTLFVCGCCVLTMIIIVVEKQVGWYLRFHIRIWFLCLYQRTLCYLYNIHFFTWPIQLHKFRFDKYKFREVNLFTKIRLKTKD